MQPAYNSTKGEEGILTYQDGVDVPSRPLTSRRGKLAIVSAVTVLVSLCVLGTVKYQYSGKLSELVIFPWEIPNQISITGTRTEGAPYNYLNYNHGAPPVSVRQPVGQFRQFSVDFFSHPKVRDAIARNPSDDARRVCGGPNGNMDVYINDQLTMTDLLDHKAYTAFSYDCRDSRSNPIIGFIVVMDMDGQIINVHNPVMRAEQVSMFNTEKILFSCIAGKGVYLWNWKTDEVQKLPFSADSNTIVYSHQENRFYGMYLEQSQKVKDRASIATAFDGASGQILWQYQPSFSHIQTLSKSGHNAFVNLRSANCLQKVNMDSNVIEWTLGGKGSDFSLYDINGNFYDANRKLRNYYKIDPVEDDIFGSFQHPNGFQHFDDRYIGLFDNNMCADAKFCDTANSRMVLMAVDQERRIAAEVFSFDTGEQSRLYGSASLLPSGNILGNSYPDVVFPMVQDRQYHVNVWEATPQGELAWRVGFRGLNPFDPTDNQNPYAHAISPNDEPPTGWNVYNVERFYDKPVVSQPCLVQRRDGSKAVKILPFNTVRTQDDLPGVVHLFDSQTKTLISKTNFNFQKSWVPRAVEIDIPGEDANKNLALLVMNPWQEGTPINVGALSGLPSCDLVENGGYRMFV
jgi:hypothetical protein|uniref:Uncharacterized protein n=1 Tax=Fibrocapsa japonica TaxID=94617 RepID=A0A7S2XXD2_9STRA|mmetsp:Transcript_2180/g.3224  ORF Transcript_2180/g.3224 Transcript_2180/m.3224 type:complete len:630 (+) Transcript_2180:115-2004(+)|eukprot:CAMPEP_0113943590 /NCGR_PEP_ID=MMETSP1339-20121228/26704_1 /TAXON_ID=94617 /ORGANISM="Fibrocapsa japonica" /LENGTH=629 /DNA_ID=CAMNT_0000948499 /DNA_START=115 /DNA_END=2004 /DNA_ORIENTATION=+ /assembly_acc=CAM_ASM_000762